MPFIAINMENMRVAQVWDSIEEALDATSEDNSVAVWPRAVAYYVKVGDLVGLAFHADD